MSHCLKVSVKLGLLIITNFVLPVCYQFIVFGDKIW